MAKLNLTKLWKRFEALYNRFDKKKISSSKLYEEMDLLLQNEEVENVVNDLGLILLGKHDDLIEAKLIFASPLENESYSDFDNKDKKLFIDPIMVIKFWHECKNLNIEDEQHKVSEQIFCRASFMKQLALLPSKLILFLIILRQLAVSANINQVNYTAGILLEDDTSFYQTILWAFNILEKKIEQLHGVNVRTKYGITWHQSEWVKTAK